MTKKYKETDYGFVQEKEGYKVIVNDPEFQELREQYSMPVGCPGCGRFMTNWDDKFFFRYGVCSKCEADWFQGRDFAPEFFKDKKFVADYVKQKIEEKQRRKIIKDEEL